MSYASINVNSPSSSYPSNTLHIDEKSFPLPIEQVSFKNQPIEFERLGLISWTLLCDMNCVVNFYQKDYGYTPKEIVSRWANKKRPVKTSGRAIERALSELYKEGYIEDTHRVNAPQHGKEKFRGKYRRVTLKGLAFIHYHEQLKTKVAIEKMESLNKPKQVGVVAELLAELNGQITYSHVASEPPSRVHLKKEIRSNLDLSIRCSKSERFDFNNQCFEEYAAQQSNFKPYVEQEALQEEIYHPVESKYRPTVKKLLDESGLENERKQEVIQAVYRQQNCNTKIVSIAGVTKKFIAEARIRQRDKIQSNKNAAYKPFEFIDLTEEQREASKKAKQIAFAEMRLKLN